MRRVRAGRRDGHSASGTRMEDGQQPPVMPWHAYGRSSHPTRGRAIDHAAAVASMDASATSTARWGHRSIPSPAAIVPMRKEPTQATG